MPEVYSDRLSPVEAPTLRWRTDKTWRFHRSVMLDRVEATESGIWASIHSGAQVTTHDESITSFDFDAIVFFPTGQWWNAIFLDDAPVGVHVDIATPATFDEHGIRTVDLDLDVVVRSGEVSVVDNDEFDTHRRQHSYSDEMVDEAERAVISVTSMIDTATFPFDGSHRQRFDALRPR